MKLRPDARARSKRQQPDRFAAVGQGEHKQARAPVLARIRFAHHGATAIIDLRFFTGCRCDDCAGFGRSLATKLYDEAPHAGIAVRETALIDKILPDRHGVTTCGFSSLKTLLTRP